LFDDFIVLGLHSCVGCCWLWWSQKRVLPISTDSRKGEIFWSWTAWAPGWWLYHGGKDFRYIENLL